MQAEDFDMRCSGTVQMLIEMELLTHADYLVASDRTKWSKILQYMPLHSVWYAQHLSQSHRCA